MMASSSQAAADPTGHLVVDGYNILHAWPQLKALMRRDLEAAADRLLEELRILHDFGGYDLILVFDGKGNQLSILHPDDTETLTVVYSPQGVTADAVIERLLAKAPDTAGWVVASADGALSQSALAYGARSLTPAALLSWCEELHQRQTAWIQRQGSS